MTKLATGLAVGLITWAGAVFAQTPDAAKLDEQMSGREIRVRESDRVVGGIRQVIEKDGGLAAVIDLEEPARSVEVDLGGIEQQGGKYYLTLSPEQLSALPDATPEDERDPSSPLPYGGLTPGWGGAPPQPSTR